MKKNTTRSLLLSIAALIVCCAMLAGTTLAWFTDSVSTTSNTIKAGNLDVELYHTSNLTSREKVKDITTLFDDVTLWEPGAVAYEKFEVENVGSLAMKYTLTFATPEVNFVKDGETVTTLSLKDVLYVKTSSTPLTRNELTADPSSGAVKLADFDSSNNLLTNSGNYLKKNETDSVYVYVYWPTAVDNTQNDTDNKYNVGNATSSGDPLYVKLNIVLNATQAPVETDSFDKNYDTSAAW